MDRPDDFGLRVRLVTVMGLAVSVVWWLPLVSGSAFEWAMTSFAPWDWAAPVCRSCADDLFLLQTTWAFTPPFPRVVLIGVLMIVLLAWAERGRVRLGGRLPLAIVVLWASAVAIDVTWNPLWRFGDGPIGLWAVGAILVPPIALAVAIGWRRRRVEPLRPAWWDAPRSAGELRRRLVVATATSTFVHAGAIVGLTLVDDFRLLIDLLDTRRDSFGDGGFDAMAGAFVLPDVVVWGTVGWIVVWSAIAAIFRRALDGEPCGRLRRTAAAVVAVGSVLVGGHVLLQVGSRGPGWGWQVALALVGPPLLAGLVVTLGRRPPADRPRPEPPPSLFGIGDPEPATSARPAEE